MVGMTVSSKKLRSNTLPWPGIDARAKMVASCVEALAVPVRAVMLALNSTLPVDEFQVVGLATSSISDGASSTPEVMIVPGGRSIASMVASARDVPAPARNTRVKGRTRLTLISGTRTGAATTSCAGVPGGAAAGSVDVAVRVIVPAGARAGNASTFTPMLIGVVAAEPLTVAGVTVSVTPGGPVAASDTSPVERLWRISVAGTVSTSDPYSVGAGPASASDTNGGRTMTGNVVFTAAAVPAVESTGVARSVTATGPAGGALAAPVSVTSKFIAAVQRGRERLQGKDEPA